MKQKQLKKIFQKVLLLIILSIPLTSCTTSKTVEKIPRIDFPDIPIDVDKVDIEVKEDVNYKFLSDVIITWRDDSTKKVTLPYWFWMDFMNFIIESEEVRKKYEYLRENYEVSEIPKL